MRANIISNAIFHLVVNKKDGVVINLGETKIKNSTFVKLLGIKFDT